MPENNKGVVCMDKLYYCKECKTILKNEIENTCCSGENLKELVIGTPVNVKGSKLKGNVFKIKDGMVTLVMRDDSNNKFMKEYEFEKLRKVL